MRPHINAIHINDGQPVKKQPRKKIRKCLICKKILSMYNDNKYCFNHIVAGWELEQKNIARKQKNTYAKHQEKMKSLAKKKRKAKDGKLLGVG